MRGSIAEWSASGSWPTWRRKGSSSRSRRTPIASNYSDRSKTPIEPYLSDQWFVRMDDLAQDAMDAVTTGAVKIHPERYAKSYLDWLGEKRDWCISRQLWWGHRIPIWYCAEAPESALRSGLPGPFRRILAPARPNPAAG